LGIISVYFDEIDQLLIRYWTKYGSAMGQYINYLNIFRKPTNQDKSAVHYSNWNRYSNETN